ncbi:MAG: chromosomal replication initiator protein DnaA [Cytophagales bacterium]
MVTDCIKIWDNCLNSIRENVNDQSFKTWFAPIKPIKLSQSVLTIQVPSPFFYEYLEEHYVQILKKAIVKELGDNARLEYSIVVDKGNEKESPKTLNISTNGNRPDEGKQLKGFGPSTEHLQNFYYDSPLNRNYSFDNFIEGDCNRLARAAGLAVADKPGITSFNPLFVYGGVGLGKTHLIQAIGNKIKDAQEESSILYVSSEKFTNQFIDALRNNKVQDFSAFYLNLDTLILDDVQFMSGKEKTQDIFFHIFNQLHQSGKQIIMTSDCPPKDLKGLQERLLSRFKWGLTADLQSPDFETRVAIIHRKMEAEGTFIPDNVIEYLAYSVDTNVRELEGVLISLIAQSSLNKKEIDLELAKQTLQNIVQDIETEVGIDYIQKYISDYFKVSPESLRAKTRKKEIVIARQVAMYFAKEYTNHSLKVIGYHFGGRDHSTVIHAIQTVNDIMDTDKKFAETMKEIETNLKVKAS